jgi:hypothetical protein
MKDLQPIYDSRASFYGKAKVEQTAQGHISLISYGTYVAVIINGIAEVYGTYSATTLRHIKEFLMQNGLKAESKQQILKDYGKYGQE